MARRSLLSTAARNALLQVPGEIEGLLSDFGERRRIATIAAQMMELSITMTDAAIVMFERLTGQLFSRSRNALDQVWAMGKARVGKLMQLFGEAIDTMSRAQELGQDIFGALDVEIGWQKLSKSRDEIAACRANWRQAIR